MVLEPRFDPGTCELYGLKQPHRAWFENFNNIV